MVLKTILIAGGTGLIGTALSHHLRDVGGYDVRILSRNPEKVSRFEAYFWNPMERKIDEEALAQVDVIINLSGANIGDKRWTKRRKKLLLESRISSNLIFKKHLKKSSSIRKYIAASAQGYYGNRGDKLLLESTPPANTGFQSTLTVKWERAINETVPEQIDTCIMRNAVVLSIKGGPIAKLKPTAKWGVVPQFSDGKHYFSWIHIDDIVRVYRKSIDDKAYIGAINVTSGATTYKAFAEAVKKAYKNKLPPIPIPAALLKLGLGQMSEIVLDSTRMSSEKLQNLGYPFLFKDITHAVEDIVQHKK